MDSTSEELNQAKDFTSPAFHKESTDRAYYLLSANYEGTTRLALQHYIWKQALGFNVHPSIPALGASASIADVACGTGSWLIDVAHETAPSSELYGFDINLNQAPPKPWLPKNVTLSHWNMYDEVPAEFVGRFDLVHVRMITIAIKENDIEPIVRNLCKLLRPGGYLQWDEIDIENCFVVKAYPELDAIGTEGWCRWVRAGAWTTKWKSDVTDLFRKQGLDPTLYDLKDKFVEHLDLMRANNDQLLMLFEQFAKRMFASGNTASNELLKLIQQASEDGEKGAAMVLPPFAWVARKPL